MRYYRLYCFDAVSRIVGVHEVQTETEDEAVAEAASITSCARSELWDRDRLVARFDYPED